ncbi:MAG TPA: CPBP family intramembrane glutamic endopeptidase [Myxococcales bacterium]|nr:CPBP family intramembrane glutamic endopeptidase [Myxococcales bacterium]
MARAAASRPGDLRASLRGFGPLGLLAIVVILSGNFLFPPLSAVLVLFWARWSGTPWREIGYVRPRSWIGELAAGLILGGLFKLAMKAVVMPLLGADPINRAYHALVGNTQMLAWMLLIVTINAGIGEETVFRGYMFERLGKLIGRNVPAKVAAVVLTSAVFALALLPDQGVAGTEQATFTGLAFGGVFARTGRLYPVMCAHAGFDLVAVAIIYLDLESRVAHLVFC